MTTEVQSKITAGRVIRWGLEQLRLSFNSIITLTVRTHKRRWKKVSQEPPPWDERNQMIAERIPAGSSVIDLGCGARTLQKHLKPGCDYQPCDVVKSAPEVIVCDFNADLYPTVSKHYDYVVCSGVLEYIRNPAEFLTRISRLGNKVILSYNPVVPGESRLFRLGWYWVNHFTREELEALFASVGLSHGILFTRPPHELVYELEKRASATEAGQASQPAGPGAAPPAT